MFPTQTPIFFPPTTRRPLVPTKPPFTPSFIPTNTPFTPSFIPTNTPSFLDVLTTTQPTEQNIIVSYSIQNNDAFIPLNFQYAVVSISGCFLITIFMLCFLLCCKKTEINSGEDEDEQIVDVSVPQQTTRVVSIKFPSQEHKHTFLRLDEPLSRRNVVEDVSQIMPSRTSYPPPQPPLTRSQSLQPTQNYYKG